MFEISKLYSFAAAHRLAGLPEDHKCARVHGHGYRVQVVVRSARLDGPGWVIDYGDLAPFGTWLDTTFDHQWLGSGALAGDGGAKVAPVIGVNPTAENLAGAFREWLRTSGHIPALTAGLTSAQNPMTVEVGVSETPNTWAWAR
jgi:6-pyruvoyltetrahydropterin/6-carboxytetrahydropterin synthase